MINAVEHGNLGITYEEKSHLTGQGTWEQQVEHRLAQSEYMDKIAVVQLQRDEQETRVTITDQGAGFDWQNYLEMDPARAFDTHGRGIAMANALSFDHLEYQGRGNRVLVSVFNTDAASDKN